MSDRTRYEAEVAKRINPDKPTTTAEALNELGAAFTDALLPIIERIDRFLVRVTERVRRP